MRDDNTGCFVWLVVIVLLLILGPVLSYFCGWLTGVILQWLMGDTIIYGMNYLFNTNRFTVDMLPTICGTLGVIGSFFKRTTITSSSK